MIISIFIIISIYVFLFHSFLICYTLSVMDQSSSHILITSNYSEPFVKPLLTQLGFYSCGYFAL